MPLLTWEINLIFNPAFKTCPITILESKIRKSLGKPEIKSFLGYYLFSPIRKKIRKWKCT